MNAKWSERIFLRWSSFSVASVLQLACKPVVLISYTYTWSLHATPVATACSHYSPNILFNMFFSFTTILSSFALGLLVQIEGAALQDIGLTNTSKSSEARDNFLRPLDLNKRATASELFSFRDVGEKGGCSTTQISTIDDWLKESVLLHNAALSAMNFGSVPADPMHLVWIMGVTFDKGTVTNPTQWKAIEGKCLPTFTCGSISSHANMLILNYRPPRRCLQFFCWRQFALSCHR